MIWSDGDKYVGEFKDDKLNGQGTYTHVSGPKYVGKFKDGQKHGKGVMTFPDGTVKKGKWEFDKLAEEQ